MLNLPKMQNFVSIFQLFKLRNKPPQLQIISENRLVRNALKFLIEKFLYFVLSSIFYNLIPRSDALLEQLENQFYNNDIVPTHSYDVSVLATNNGFFMNDQFQFVFRLTMAVNLVLQPNVTIDDFKALVAAEGRTDINIQG